MQGGDRCLEFFQLAFWYAKMGVFVRQTKPWGGVLDDCIIAPLVVGGKSRGKA